MKRIIAKAAPTERFFAAPAHPYTRALLDSLPDPHGEIRDIPGELPGLIDPPAGCRFRPRCAAASAACSARPEPRALADGHAVRCHHPLVHQ